MRVEEVTVEIRSVNFGRVGIIDPEFITDLKAIKRFNSVGQWSMSLPKESNAATLLASPGRGIVIYGPVEEVAGVLIDGVLFSGSISDYTVNQTSEDPVGRIAFNGVDDNIHAADGLAFPEPDNDDVETQAESHDVRSGVAETVLRGYFGANRCDGTAPSSRAIAGLGLIGPDLGRGATLEPVRARFDNLGALMSDVAAIGGLGWDIRQDGDGIGLYIYEPEDKTRKIQMDIDNDLVERTSYGFGAPRSTRPVVAGQGEMEDRAFVQVTSAESLAAESIWGRKIETFKDRRDAVDTAELTQAGELILSESGDTIVSLSVVPRDAGRMRYAIDWRLGDLVSAIIDGEAVSAVVTESIMSISSEGVRFAATIGDPIGFDYDSKTLAVQRKQESRIATLERSEGGSSLGDVDLTGAADGDMIIRTGGVWVPHTPTVAATASRVIQRDPNGRAKVGLGNEAGDIATVDQLQRRNLLCNGSFRTNQRGYVSGAYGLAGVYGFDMWKANGLVVRNYALNPSAETNTTGYTTIPGPTGVAALTSATPSTTTAYGTKVMKCTWSTASGADVAGAYYALDRVAANLAIGETISFGFYHVKASINQRLRVVLSFYNSGAFISQQVGTEKQVTAGTIYTAASNAEFKIEGVVIPAATTTIIISIYSIAGTGFVSWPVSSYMELDGLMINQGATLLPYFDGATADSTHFDYSWSGTANASVSTRASLTALTFTADPYRGQTVTISTEGIIAQVVERANIKSGTHTVAWTGTALGRAYKSGTTPPSFGASPITLTGGTTLDGSGDIIVEFSAGTLADVNFTRYAGALPFILEEIRFEQQRCMYYFQVLESGANEYFGFGQAYSTTLGFGFIKFATPMRTAPTVTRSAATDFATFTAAGSDAVLSALTFQEATTRSVRFNATAAAVLTVGQAMQMHGITTNARIYADASP